ncbi:hypothetical protein I3843_12G037400 [Carya illinoinensis]|uniref:Uncharacterized protein n=1 Tax=Carya illinoinensis TaxID=32201 RepID=A0A8T1NX58_CARIL|nr:hypothetical protein CIPAW_12G038000 [Carya illinoinensis]KAG7952024.1 hypothetical protein I3843_12G037400 [Carya illinoinensis]
MSMELLRERFYSKVPNIQIKCNWLGILLALVNILSNGCTKENYMGECVLGISR